MLGMVSCETNGKKVLTKNKKQVDMSTDSSKMVIEVWSDIACPFCYIGKQKFEKALEKVDFKESVQIVWRSFQLDPNAQYMPDADYHEKLAKKYGKSREWAVQMGQNVANMGEDAGLTFNMNSLKSGNTLQAHRLIHLAAESGKQTEAQKVLFEAYFVNGENLEDFEVIKSLGAKLNLDSSAVSQMLESDLYKKEVLEDQAKASSLGINGVPFFLFDGQLNVSGAQDVNHFVKILNKSYGNWKEKRIASQKDEK
jgi:predicted DsbA family dithiol-disulfide isomerase